MRKCRENNNNLFEWRNRNSFFYTFMLTSHLMRPLESLATAMYWIYILFHCIWIVSFDSNHYQCFHTLILLFKFNFFSHLFFKKSCSATVNRWLCTAGLCLSQRENRILQVMFRLQYYGYARCKRNSIWMLSMELLYLFHILIHF